MRGVVLVRPFPGLLRRALDMGVLVGVATGPDRPVQQPERVSWTVVSQDTDILLRAITALCRPDEVYALSLNEPGLPVVAAFNAGGPWAWFTPTVCQRFADKWAMRCHLAGEVGLGDVGARAVGGLADLVDAVSRWPAGAVVKPRFGTGSAGVHLLAGDRIDDVWQEVRAENGTWLVEEFLPGDEVTTESFNQAGTHTMLALVRKVLFPSCSGHFVSQAHVVTCDPADVLWNEAARVTDQLLTRMELAGGPAHSQWKCADGKLRLIESHPRTSGDLIPAAISFLTGIDLYSLAIAHAAGRPVSLHPRRSSTGAVAVVYGQAMVSGRVSRIAGLDIAAASAGVITARTLVEVGDRVRPAVAAADRVSVTMASGASGGEALERAMNASRQITVDVR